MGRDPRHARRTAGGRWRLAAAGFAVVVIGATVVSVQTAGAEGRPGHRGATAHPSPGAPAPTARHRRPHRPIPSTPAPTSAAPSTTRPAPAPTPAPTSTPPRTTAPTPSGRPLPTGDLPGWRQVFTDDFTTPAALGSFPGPAYGPKWGAYAEGWKDTSGQGTYSPARTLSASGGLLNINLHTENGQRLVAAPTPRLPGTYGQRYGRYTVRFRADAVPGYKTAWLLWPDSDNWNDGEIDFPEGGLDGRINAFAHHAGDPRSQDAFATTATYTSWHTATIEWSPGKVVFLLDDKTIGTSTTKVPTTPMHLVLQTETCLGCTTPATAAGNVQLDWIAVYARA